MIRDAINEYEPDYVSPPGETLRDALKSLRMSQAALARRMGRPVKTINEIIKGKAGITPETALQLERVLGIPAHFWNAREGHYREFLARTDERKRMNEYLDWLRGIPVNDMAKLGWIEKRREKLDQLVEVLKFFGVAGPDQWKDIWTACSISCRRPRAFRRDMGPLSAWLRQGEIVAQTMQTADFDLGSFRAALQQIRDLTQESPDVFVPEMTQMCAESGVALAFVPEIKGSAVYGAARWLNPGNALMQLSLRGKTDDHLWFTFFHEAAHILLHGKTSVFIEGLTGRSRIEDEADNFAKNQLIPKARYNQFVRMGSFAKNDIRLFARTIGIAPGIVVGRLQHDGNLDFRYCNDLKVRYSWQSAA